MRDFFHGSRRKAGCVTLVMELALMAGWVRSYVAIDWGHLSTGSINMGFQSFSGCLYLYVNTGPGFSSLIRWGSQPKDAVGLRLVENAANWTFPLIPALCLPDSLEAAKATRGA